MIKRSINFCLIILLLCLSSCRRSDYKAYANRRAEIVLENRQEIMHHINNITKQYIHSFDTFGQRVTIIPSKYDKISNGTIYNKSIRNLFKKIGVTSIDLEFKPLCELNPIFSKAIIYDKDENLSYHLYMCTPNINYKLEIDGRYSYKKIYGNDFEVVYEKESL